MDTGRAGADEVVAAVRVLVAGVGNVLLHDDGFGVEVVRRLSRETMPDNVRVENFGIRALHLAYELLEGYTTLIIVDAMARGEAPGTLFVFEPELATDRARAADAQGLYPGAVLRMALGLGACVRMVRVIGCEPASREEGAGLSPAVEDAVPEAVRVVRELALASASASSAANDEAEKPAMEAC